MVIYGHFCGVTCSEGYWRTCKALDSPLSHSPAYKEAAGTHCNFLLFSPRSCLELTSRQRRRRGRQREGSLSTSEATSVKPADTNQITAKG
ncbi:hypothetical protein ATANTOWER_025151 [Ataeniobius toweri]|uniref:Uncharacterized protein n=1 Tax=Ataeniobius toweri TaxID=208326 RepID=A0ABU7AC65_9TELE|nr:hypothetical protein [Ataeniobius toweri]